MAQTYTVKSGDNLSTIAARYGVSMSQVSGYRSGNPNLIYPGEVLTINVPSAQPSGPVGNDSSQTYTYNQTSYAYGTGPYASQFPKKTISQPTNNQPSGPVGNEASQTYIYNNTSYAYGTGPYASQFPKKTTSSGSNNNNNNNQQQQQQQQPQQPQQPSEPTQTWYVLSSSGALYFSVTGTQAQADSAARSKGLSGYQLSTSPNTSSNNNGGSSAPASTDLSWLKNDPNYKALTPDLQGMVNEYYGTLTSGDKQKQEALLKVLATAQSQSTPYIAEVINIAKDNLTQYVSGKEADFATQEKELTDSISRIKEALANKTSDMTIDEQAQLARQGVSYKQNLSSLRQNAANTGLTFSSKRSLAEQQLATSNTDIVTSTRNDYMRQARDLQIAADNGQADAIAKLADYKRVLGDTEMQAIRDTAAKIGTANLPSLVTTGTGVTPLRTLNGTIQDDYTKDLFARATALASLGNNFQ